ncbi:MAG: FmdB family zinc ribbon protein [Acidimicrobiales bacterium]
MPTYEYKCKSCGHTFDIVQAFTDDALTECPSCGEQALKKVFGNVGITFKGSGFYKTDSRSAGSFGSTKDADKSDTGSSAKAEPASDAKGASSSSSSSTGDSTSGSSSSAGSSTSTSAAKSA